MVWEQIVNLAISNGLFAVMFLGLLIYQLRDSRNRENRYQNTIEKLGKALEVVNDVKDDVEEIKAIMNTKYIRKGGTNVEKEN